MASIEFRNVAKSFDNGKVTVIPDLSFAINDKEFVVLVGPSGCGKSTTLRMIAGLEEATQGEIYIDDKLVNGVAPKDRDIAMVFQSYALYPHMSVYKNMAFALKLRKMPKKEIDQKVHTAAKMLGIEQLLDRKPGALSGGQRQRVALGRAMVRNPKVFLLDEPLSNLDAKLRTEMRSRIALLHKQLQTTFVYVTHDQTEAMTMADRIIVMDKGIVRQYDTPQKLYSEPADMFVAGFIGSPSMNFVDCTVRKNKDKITVDFAGNSMCVPGKKAKALEPYVDRTVVMGVRPENISAYSDGQSVREGCVITAETEIAENTGGEVNVYFNLADSRCIASVRTERKISSGDVIRLFIDSNAVHFFDKETTGAISAV